MKTIKFLSVAIALATMSACSNTDDEIVIPDNKCNLTSQTDDMLNFDSKEELLDAIINGSEAKTRTVGHLEKIKSLVDEIDLNDPNLPELTEDEKAIIAEEHLTYYDAFGFDEIIPNRNFARLINLDGEVCVKDTIYKITERGTLYTPKHLRDELELVYDNITDEPIFLNGEEEKQLSPNVRIFNTYKIIEMEEDGVIVVTSNSNNNNTNTTSASPSWQNTNQETSEIPIPGGYLNGGIKMSKYKGTPLDQIPFNTFSTHPANYENFTGKLWSKVFGMKSVKHGDIIKGKYRTDGAVYDYDYKLYHECGMYVGVSKKRSGTLKFINGWKSVKPDELVIDIQCLVMEYNYPKTPNLTNLLPEQNKIDGHNTIINYNGERRKCINVLGRSIKEKDIYKAAGQGAKEFMRLLKQQCSGTVPEDIGGAMVLTPEKIYTVMFPGAISSKDGNYLKKDKLRFEYDKGFYFSYTPDLLSLNFDFKSATKLFKHLLGQKSTFIHIKKARVRMAGKINDRWGGMIINHNFSE